MLAKRDLALTIDLINICLRIKQKEDLVNLHAILGRELGIESLIVGHISKQSEITDAYFFGIHQNWNEIYSSNNFSKVDPVLNMAMKKCLPVDWCDAYAQAPCSSKTFIQMSHDYRLTEGITLALPQHAISACATVASIGNAEKPLCHIQTIILQQLLPHLLEILARQSLWERPNLTPKELEILRWCAVGKSYWELSVILSISERTVKFHMNNICKKLNTTNKSQAVARGLSFGLVAI